MGPGAGTFLDPYPHVVPQQTQGLAFSFSHIFWSFDLLRNIYLNLFYDLTSSSTEADTDLALPE